MKNNVISISLPRVSNHEFEGEYYAIVCIGIQSRLWGVGSSVEDVKRKTLDRILAHSHDKTYRVVVKRAINNVEMGRPERVTNQKTGSLYVFRCDEKLFIYTQLVGHKNVRYIFTSDSEGTKVLYLSLKKGVLRYG